MYVKNQLFVDYLNLIIYLDLQAVILLEFDFYIIYYIVDLII